jgi:hypothetical protein
MTPLLRKYPRPVQEVVPRCRDWRSFITAPAVLSSASVVSVATMDSYRLQVRHDGKRVRLLTHPGYAVLWIPEGDLARTVDETAAVAKRVAYSVAMKAQAAPVSPQDRSRTRSLLSSMTVVINLNGKMIRSRSRPLIVFCRGEPLLLFRSIRSEVRHGYRIHLCHR